MHRVARASIVLATAALLGASYVPANAKSPHAPKPVIAPVYPGGTDPTIKIKEPGAPAGIGRHSGSVNNVGSIAHPKDFCTAVPAIPQPPVGSPYWKGHTTGGIFVTECTLNGVLSAPPDQIPLLPYWLPDGKTAKPTATPAQAAQQAVASLHLPKPGVHRSPPETNRDAGVAYTWINLWTWYWSTPASWKTLSKTAKLPGVSATVKATPEELTFDPGDGSAAVTCDGPGRPWTAADGDGAPTSGGCAYAYKHVSDGVRAKVSIRWGISWTGTGGVGGDLPDLNTTTTSPSFKVEQIQVVNR